MSSATCGVGSTSMFGGLCSGNNRRPSMFTAKYRLREERKKVLKMSMGKVKRIEDPESFLRRSVLINNTIKRLQREVREEKMMRHGGGYSKLACHSFRKSFPSSRLSDMHLPDDDSSSLSSFRNSSFLNNNNGLRKRPPSDEPHDCHLLSGMYVPPTPCVISGLDDDDEDSSIDISPRKKAKLSMSADGSSLLVSTDECTLDVDVDVDVVGDVETISDWPTPPSPPPPQTDPPASHSAMACDPLHDSLSAPPLDLDVDVRCGVSGVDTMDLSAVIGVQGDPSGDTSLVINEEEEVDCEFLNAENISLTPETVAPSDDASSPAIHSALSFRNELLLSPPHPPAHPAHLMEDMSSESSEHCKENTCDFPGGGTTSPSSPHLPTSIVQKCSQPPPPPSSCSCNNNNNNANDSNCCSSKTCESCQTSSSSSSINPPSGNPPPDSKQQYSSCGHSSIFGELQSVVFHSLIASLET